MLLMANGEWRMAGACPGPLSMTHPVVWLPGPRVPWSVGRAPAPWRPPRNRRRHRTLTSELRMPDATTSALGVGRSTFRVACGSWSQCLSRFWKSRLSMNLSLAGARAFQPAASHARQRVFERRCGQESPRAVPARGSWSPCLVTSLPSILPLNRCIRWVAAEATRRTRGHACLQGSPPHLGGYGS